PVPHVPLHDTHTLPNSGIGAGELALGLGEHGLGDIERGDGEPGTRTQLGQRKRHTPAPGAELQHPARREAARELDVKGHVLVVVLVLEVVVARAIVDHIVHGGFAHPPSGVVWTSTVMPRKSEGAPVHVPATGMAWLGSRVTATRTSF